MGGGEGGCGLDLHDGENGLVVGHALMMVLSLASPVRSGYHAGVREEGGVKSQRISGVEGKLGCSRICFSLPLLISLGESRFMPGVLS